MKNKQWGIDGKTTVETRYFISSIEVIYVILKCSLVFINKLRCVRPDPMP